MKEEEEKEEEDEKENLVSSEDDIQSSIIKSIFSTLHRRRGLLWALLSAFSMSFQIYALRSLTATSNPWQTIFTRSIFLSFMSVGVKWQAHSQSTMLTLAVFILCGICDVLIATLLVSATQYIPMGDVSSISQNAPIPATLTAAVFLGESLNIVGVFLIIINGIGLVIVSKPSFLFPVSSSEDDGDQGSSLAILGVLFSFMSLAFNVTFIVLTRFLVNRNEDDAFLILTLNGMVGIAITTAVLAVTSSWDFPDSCTEWFMFVAVGALAISTLGTYLKAIETETVQTTCVLLTVCIPLSYLYDVIIYQNSDWPTFIGASLIFISTIALLFN